jgi:hypothetical protein
MNNEGGGKYVYVFCFVNLDVCVVQTHPCVHLIAIAVSRSILCLVVASNHLIKGF